ncbi:MAG TPA: mechanosensitive ion channel domain-containing protein [Bacteroidales bacterium]|nr:mechanosensitive ion channel domain-containing protein [Bacteroidales bacterium]
MENPEKYLDLIYSWLVTNGINLLTGIIVLVAGLWVVGIITRWFDKIMEKRDLNPSLRPFLKSLFNVTLKILLVITVMSMVGIQMTSFIAILGAAGLAIGMALSGTLQNFAGGVIILILKPFKVGDYITAGGHSGTVHEIQIFNTILKTPDNKTIILPNGSISNNSMINFSEEPTRRVDLEFGIGYSDDIDKAKEILWDIIKKDERVLKDPEALIAVKELANSSVNIAVRVWVKSENYWPYFWDIHESVKKEFDKNGVSIPFPQTDVHLYNTENSK